MNCLSNNFSHGLYHFLERTVLYIVHLILPIVFVITPAERYMLAAQGDFHWCSGYNEGKDVTKLFTNVSFEIHGHNYGPFNFKKLAEIL